MMPTPESKLSLSNKEKAIILKWIEQGAIWKEHWSFLPVKKPKLPTFEKDNKKIKNPIDNFIYDKLIRNDLSFSEIATKEKLKGMNDENCPICMESMKGRLINEAEIILSYQDGKYFERTDAGAAFESKAPLKAEIINLLANQSLGVTDIANYLKRHKGQISEKNEKLEPPTFGLNFLEQDKPSSREFMLLCGFEKFDNFFVRIDILERLFVKIINESEKNKNEIKLIPEMLNLLGCKKEDFIKLIEIMGYKTFSKNEEVYFKYFPKKTKNLKSHYKNKNDNPFGILDQLNLK